MEGAGRVHACVLRSTNTYTYTEANTQSTYCTCRTMPWRYVTVSYHHVCWASSSAFVLSLHRSWWIADAAWTPCGTLLVAISKRGSLILFSRLSGPALASVCGGSLDMGPCTHLPIHPLVIVQ